MTDTTQRPATAFEAPLDRTRRPGSLSLALLLAVALVAGAVTLSMLERGQALPYILAFLAVLAAVGVFALFGGAIGVLRFAGRPATDDFARGLAADAEDGILVTDADGAVIFANKAYMALTGTTTPDDLQSVERAFASEPEVAEAVYRLAQAARAGRRAQEEFRVRSGPEGGPAWLRIRVRPMQRPGERRPGCVWTLADVTRERERQENVFQELQHAIDFLDHAPAGFFSAEADGTVTYMNATLAGWLGYDLTDVGGQRLEDLLAGDGAALVNAMGGAPGGVRTSTIDVDLRTRNGQPVAARLMHKVAFAADGSPGPSRTLVLDRSGGGEAAADTLRAAEVRFARFFNNTPIAIATVDRHGRIGRTNAAFARLFGDLLKSGEGRTLPALVAEPGREALAAALRTAAAGQGEVAPLELALEGEPGNRQARFFFSAVEAEEASGEAAIVYALDTSAQRALEVQFVQSQKMQAIGQLAGGVAHDFNNVLTAIIGYSDLLLASHRPSDPSFQDIMQIKQNANRAAGLVRQLLAFSRRQTLRPQVLALGDVLSDLRILLARLLGENIKLDVVHGRDLWPVKADLNQFEQVIVNLAVNARDAMPGGGELSIRTGNLDREGSARFGAVGLPAGDWVMIEVADSGAGMEPEILDKIFEPFFSTKEVGKGTGLGLSTVYGIVKQTGGYVFVESTVGRGSVFRIFLPRHTAEPEEAPRPVEAQAAAADLTGAGTVLLVEDEDAVRSFASRALESRGYTVLAAGSGVEALELLDERDDPVDLVVSDVVMPEMDGPTLLKELRRRRPELKIIFISGYAEDAFKKNLGDNERFVFLPKPFSLKQLVEAVKDTMG